MKFSFVIVGLGSIGQRHLRNLVTLGASDITLVRTGRGTLKNDLLTQYPTQTNLHNALETKPTAVIISNPTAYHIDVAIQAAEHGCHIFLEKPISHTMDGVNKLNQIIRERNLKAFVGFQLRFHPSLREIKSWLEQQLVGEIVSVHAHWGEYLPGWHPWEDYRHSYSGRQDMGGGVLLTLCHPFDYLRWLFGDIQCVFANIDQRTGLDLDTEDIALVNVRFASGILGSVYLDYIQRPTQNNLLIIGQKGTIRWNNHDSSATIYRVETEETFTYYPPDHFERNTLFLNEMSQFIDCITNGELPYCDLHDGINALKIVLAAKKSATERREIDVSESF